MVFVKIPPPVTSSASISRSSQYGNNVGFVPPCAAGRTVLLNVVDAAPLTLILPLVLALNDVTARP